MRDITADEIAMVNGGDFNEFWDNTVRMFNNWFNRPPQQNQPTQLTPEQLQQVANQCIAAGGNFRTGGGSFSFEFMGMRIGGGSASATGAGWSCEFNR